MHRSTLVIALLLCACGGSSDEPAQEPTTETPTATGGGEAEPMPVADPAAAQAELRDFFEVVSLGVSDEARQRMGAASYQTEDVEEARAACFPVLEAFLAGNYEIFDLDRQCLRWMDRLGAAHEVTERPDVSSYRALQQQAIEERRANAPPLPEDFAPTADARTLEGDLTDADPTVRDGSHYDDYPIDLREGWSVTLDMISSQFDCYIWLLDPEGRSLAQDDDGGEGLNSHLTYPIDYDGRYIIRANSFSSRDRGHYEVRVQVDAGSQ